MLFFSYAVFIIQKNIKISIVFILLNDKSVICQMLLLMPNSNPRSSAKPFIRPVTE